MGWIFMACRKAELTRSLNDDRKSLSDLSRLSKQLSSFATAIGDGTITPSEINNFGLEVFGEAMDFMEYAHIAADRVASQKTARFASTYGSLSEEQYYNNPTIAAQVQLYYTDGQLDTTAIYADLYNEALEDFAQTMVAPELNEKQKEIDNQIADLETQIAANEAELEQLNESIRQNIQSSTIQLA